MTSHSPLVVSNLSSNDQRNKVFRLVAGEKKPHELPDLFGIDYDDVLLDWMEGYPRNEELDFLKSSIKRALDMGNEQLVLMRKNELVELLHSEKKAEQMIAKWKNE